MTWPASLPVASPDGYSRNPTTTMSVRRAKPIKNTMLHGYLLGPNVFLPEYKIPYNRRV